MSVDQPLARRARLRNALVGLAVILLAGIVGYSLIEPHYTLLDALYMTVITVTTVGYGEVHDLSPAGRWFTMFLLVGGLGTVGYAGVVVAEELLESGLHRALGKRNMARHIDRLQDHIIVCGFGRVGEAVCRELRHRQSQFVVIDPKGLDQCPEDYLVVQGDATEDDVLHQAHIERARGLICTLSDEAESVLLTLTARQLNADLFITCRADSERTERKLKRVGANRVIRPHQVGARRMAVTTLQPNVFDVFTLLAGEREDDFALEELVVEEQSALAEHTLAETDVRSRYQVSVVGLKRRQGEPVVMPTGDFRIEAGDILVVVGPADGIRRFQAGCERSSKDNPANRG